VTEREPAFSSVAMFSDEVFEDSRHTCHAIPALDRYKESQNRVRQWEKVWSGLEARQIDRATSNTLTNADEMPRD